jgi:hypothetical protein
LPERNLRERHEFDRGDFSVQEMTEQHGDHRCGNDAAEQ